ncbi:MAG: hypothetical protein HKM95_03985 [Inquilinus sp.]|nr:hypothetical protein [Inquilinus sp.]
MTTRRTASRSRSRHTRRRFSHSPGLCRDRETNSEGRVQTVTNSCALRGLKAGNAHDEGSSDPAATGSSGSTMLREQTMRINELVRQMDEKRWRSLNMIASENIASEAVSEALASDFANRYLIPEERPECIWDFPNQSYNREVARITEDLAKKLFVGEYADVRPLSGNNIAYIIITSHVPIGGTVFRIPDTCGGHFATVPICEREGINVVDIPFDRDTCEIDLEALRSLYRRHRPELIFLDASMVLFPQPTAGIRAAVGPEAVISYDASHPLGLIAGQGFANPLLEGADVVHGSTHKSMFGPQKGLIVCREDGEVAAKIRDNITPLFVSNSHVHHIAALGVALEELDLHGKVYARQVIRNAQTLAATLDAGNVEVFTTDKGYTQSHQIWAVIGDKDEAYRSFRALERINIHVNQIKVPFTDRYGFRIGASELTRRGFKEGDMRQVGELMVRCIRENAPPATLLGEVEAFALSKRRLSYSFDDDAALVEPAPTVALV